MLMLLSKNIKILQLKKKHASLYTLLVCNSTYNFVTKCIVFKNCLTDIFCFNVAMSEVWAWMYQQLTGKCVSIISTVPKSFSCWSSFILVLYMIRIMGMQFWIGLVFEFCGTFLWLVSWPGATHLSLSATVKERNKLTINTYTIRS